MEELEKFIGLNEYTARAKAPKSRKEAWAAWEAFYVEKLSKAITYEKAAKEKANMKKFFIHYWKWVPFATDMKPEKGLVKVRYKGVLGEKLETWISILPTQGYCVPRHSDRVKDFVIFDENARKLVEWSHKKRTRLNRQGESSATLLVMAVKYGCEFVDELIARREAKGYEWNTTTPLLDTAYEIAEEKGWFDL